MSPSRALKISDPWAAFQLDGAVALFGTVIENAAAETITSGSKNNETTRPRYTIHQLLDPAFRLPRPALPGEQGDMLLAGVHGLMVDEVL